MFYRYEAKNKDGQYEGIFSFFNPSERRYFNRFLREPKWYENNPDTDSKCWFTEEGYNKYHNVIDEILSGNVGYRSMSHLEIRLVTKETLDNVVCKGKIQCIELV